MSGNKLFCLSLSEVPSPRPATARVLIERRVDGQFELRSTLSPEETIEVLDGAMESIDGQRLPPDSNGSNGK